MKSMRGRCVVGVCLCVLLWAGGVCADRRTGTHTLRMTASGKLPTVGTVHVELSLGRPCDSGRGYWGEPESTAHMTIRECRLTIAGKRVEVPRSAFADLSEVNWVRVGGVPDSGLVIEGSDAAGGYRATFAIRRLGVVRRIVHSMEFPDDVREITTYHLF